MFDDEDSEDDYHDYAYQQGYSHGEAHVRSAIKIILDKYQRDPARLVAELKCLLVD